MATNLLTLPAEIRSLIFEFAVTCPERVTFYPDNLQRQYYAIAAQPPLTRVNRQIRDESLPIYYEANNFVLHTEEPKADDARRWLKSNEKYLRDIRHLSLWFRYVPPGETLNQPMNSQGAFSFELRRQRDQAQNWAVASNDSWRWITVTRKPVGLKDDIAYLQEKMQHKPYCADSSSSESIIGMMCGLRGVYAHRKSLM